MIIMVVDINNYIHTVQDFPKTWIAFKDISPILSHPEAFHYVVDELTKKVIDADVIVWLDARWFIFWAAVAYKLQKPFVMIRKKWKLPWEIIEESYELEYGVNTQVMQKNSIQKWQTVAIIDDLLATWGTAVCACNLIEKLWWIVQWCHFVVVLDDLNGADKLEKYMITSLY